MYEHLMTLFSKNQYVKRLVTQEDPFHIHKTMGVFCLMNFVVQFCLYATTGNMVLSRIIMLPHILLHATSFLFKVLERRPVSQEGRIVGKMSMFIWKELRLHSLSFGSRSVLVVMYPSLSFIFVVVNFIVADIVTHYYGTPNVTTVRGNSQLTKGTRSFQKYAYSAFFSTSQLGATIVCAGFMQEKINPVLVFSTLPAIQTSAFGMTLLRKDIISKSTWQVVYSLELLLVYFVWYKEYSNFHILFYSTFAYLLRVLGLNKYALWALFACATAISTEPTKGAFLDISGLSG